MMCIVYVNNMYILTQYGHAWMLAAVKERQESDRAQLSPRAELQAYLKSPLELTDDVVGWWGVCFGF